MKENGMNDYDKNIYKMRIYETIPDLPTIAKGLIAMIDNN